MDKKVKTPVKTKSSTEKGKSKSNVQQGQGPAPVPANGPTPANGLAKPSIPELQLLSGTSGPKKKEPRPKPFAKPLSTKGKMRVRLPPIESYEKELEFQCEGPGRVIVRLERLMGSNKVRINDPKYMSTLLSKLEEDEEKVWNQREMARKKAERDRFRQLVIEGVMEPGPDMKDLLNHPIFRVNRILNRLSKLDISMHTGPQRKLPPMTPCEPFHDKDYLENGILFADHTDHYRRTGDLKLGSYDNSKSDQIPRSKTALSKQDSSSKSKATLQNSGLPPRSKTAVQKSGPATKSKTTVQKPEVPPRSKTAVPKTGPSSSSSTKRAGAAPAPLN